MSPKKVKNPTPKKNIAQKMPKRTVRKEKPKLNMPANIKVSIPISFTRTESETMGRSLRNKRQLDPAMQLELANEVANRQLAKQIPHKFDCANINTEHANAATLTPIQNVENATKGPKRGRRKRVISDFFQNRIVIENSSADAVVNSAAAKSPEKNGSEEKPQHQRRIVTRKRLADSTAKQQEQPKMLKIEPNTETETINTQIKIEPNPDVDVDPDVSQQPIIVEPSPAEEEPLPVVVPPKPTVKLPKPRTRRTKPVQTPQRSRPRALRVNKESIPGKQDQIVEPNKSPSILEPMRKLPKTEPEVEFIIQQVPKSPLPVDSRKTSVSSNSNMSWTKDISSSSTTTCLTVSSHDFVRFNKKLPIIKLTNIDNELKKRKKDVKETSHIEGPNEDSSDTSDSNSSDSERKLPVSQQLNDSIEVHSLHLSASSPSSSRFPQIRSKDNMPDYIKAAEKLTLTMKKIDMEIINWISSETVDVNANLSKFKDKMFDILDNEFGVITHCRRLKEILEPPIIVERIEKPFSPKAVEKTVTNVKEVIENNNPVVEINKDKEVEFLKPKPCRKLSSVSDGNVSIISSNSGRRHSSDDDNILGNTKNPCYDHHDDDDTLSLFAESITGFDSIKMNTSTASVPNTQKPIQQVEEYVPKPVGENFVPHAEKHAPVTYCPTKIRDDAEVIISKIKTICEKQNADSTSIYKQSISTDDTESYQDLNDNPALDSKTGPPEIMKRPRLMESFFEGSPRARSIVFANICFYNLVNCCRKMFLGTCRFRHVKPTSDLVKDKLSRLDERSLMQEYLLLRNWPDLRRMYGMCYVEECAKRGLTRLLVEMAYDSIVKARNDSPTDTSLRVNTIEMTLLHLNNVDLSECEDLLKLTIHSDKVNRTLLCDVFMATMSITQNFSRFKLVFLNLTYFMVDNDRTFHKDVVDHILERVCILPFEEPVARALIQMMRLTSPEIFMNSMLGHFEKQISVNKDVFEEYSLLKNHHEFTSMLASSVVAASPPPRLEQAVPARPEAADDQPPAPSPDTTNLDNVNKTADEPMQPVITRTIGMNQPIIFNRTQRSPCNPGPSRSQNSSGSSNSDDTDNQNVRKWRNRAIFPHSHPPTMMTDHMMRAPSRTPARPLVRPHMRPPPRMPFNKRLVMFRGPAHFADSRGQNKN